MYFSYVQLDGNYFSNSQNFCGIWFFYSDPAIHLIRWKIISIGKDDYFILFEAGYFTEIKSPGQGIWKKCVVWDQFLLQLLVNANMWALQNQQT